MKLYKLTQKKEYLDFASYIVLRGGAAEFNIFENALEGKLYPYQWPVTKAYEIMSCFEGLIEYYSVTGVERWKKAAEKFYELVMDSDVTIIGCCGCVHELFNHSKCTQTNIEYDGVMQETCVTVTWMKLCYKMLMLMGECKYADEIEKSLYNAMYGSVNINQCKENKGLPFDSYSPLFSSTLARGVGGYKEMEGREYYGCCAAIGAAGTAFFPKAAVMTSERGIVFNLYEKVLRNSERQMGSCFMRI